ncbi:hypothetical protein LA080_000883 [Diaporthe eres]|nr:hypothetical protein LA080_000883 [Diaporthe eres]
MDPAVEASDATSEGVQSQGGQVRLAPPLPDAKWDPTPLSTEDEDDEPKWTEIQLASRIGDLARVTEILGSLYTGNLRLIRLLLEAGAIVDPEKVTRYQGRTPIQAAAESGHEEVVLLLLDLCANINAPASPSSGITALQAACFQGHIKLASLLIARGADCNSPPGKSNGYTALQGACLAGEEDIVRMLLDSDADVNAPGSPYDGGTALHAAVSRGNIRLVNILLSANANPNSQAGRHTSLPVMKESPPFLRVSTNNNNSGIRGKWADQQEEERFDHLASSTASVGHARIGKMDVDIRCPTGLSLKNLWVLLTLEDVPFSGEPVDATRFFDEKEDKNNENNHDAGVPCQFTEFYRPHALRGSIVSRSSASQFLGYGIAALQTGTAKTRKTEIPWEVRGSLRRDSGTGIWKTLEWDIYTNDLEGSRARHSSFNRIRLEFRLMALAPPPELEWRFHGISTLVDSGEHVL